MTNVKEFQLSIDGTVNFEYEDGQTSKVSLSSVDKANNSSFPTVKDSDGTSIGIAGNIYEVAGETADLPKSILLTAPLPVPPSTKIDCGAFWYQDFGLTYIKQNVSASWMGWYDWRWNWISTDGYNSQGYYPDKFETFVRKAIEHVNNGKGFPMIYNVSEWTEGGPGLQPNMKDGFGYLTALKNALTK